MAQHFDPNTGRPLPTPVWFFGTGELRTEEQWYRHLTKWRDWAAGMCLSLSVLGLVLFVAWPAPGFGQGIAIALWLWSLLVSPAYFMYRRDVHRYFPDGFNRQGNDG